MRFMMLVIPKDYAHAKPGAMPDAKVVEAMSKYNDALMKAGVLLSLNGLHPLSTGARVSFAGGKPSVTDGPFVETKEVIGGYWMINVSSREAAIAWAKQAPMPDGEIIEIRQIQEFEDFTPEVQKATGDKTSVYAEMQKSNQPCDDLRAGIPVHLG
ncbi:MAG: YciI family protein [Stenotrophobium sp.]